MTPQQINEKIAKKLGFIKSEGPFGDVHFGGIRKIGWKLGDVIFDRVPDYCGSIETAWTLLTGHCEGWSMNSAGGKLNVKLWNRYCGRSASHDDIAMAICLAFVKFTIKRA